MRKRIWGRKNFIQSLRQQTSLSMPECSRMLEEIITLMKAGLQEDRKIKIRNFGTFYVYTSKARIGRNPKTGEEKIIPPRKNIRFKRSLVLEKSLNNATDLNLNNETISTSP